MAAVKMVGANTVEFHAVHRTGKQRDDGKPRAIIARFVNRETRNEFWNRRKELANSPNYQNVVVVPDYAYETAKEQKKLSNDDEKCEIRTKLEIKKQSLEQVISYKTQGSIIRSKTRWYNEGEKIQSISSVWKKGIIMVKQ